MMKAKTELKFLAKNCTSSLFFSFINSYKPTTTIKKVVFVCKGNICRSAFAHHVLSAAITKNVLTIDSCGLDVKGEIPVPFQARKAALKFGVNLDSHRSKSISRCNLEDADLIVGMEFSHYLRLAGLFPEKKRSITLLRRLAPFPRNLLCNINDPFEQEDIVFERCFHQIKVSILGMKAKYKLDDRF